MMPGPNYFPLFPVVCLSEPAGRPASLGGCNDSRVAEAAVRSREGRLVGVTSRLGTGESSPILGTPHDVLLPYGQNLQRRGTTSS